MPTDNVTPLATTQDFNQSAFADLAANLGPAELTQVMLQATRDCEAITDRRLAPFTITETCRLEDGDIDDFGIGGLPIPMQAQMGIDYARALSIGEMVRHAYVREYPPVYQEMWTGALTQVQVFWPYQSAPYTVGPQMMQYDVDTGHIRFLIGTFVPFGSQGYITYSGGYTTIPVNLNRACITLAAKLVVDELDPAVGSQHDPDWLEEKAVSLLEQFSR